MSSFNETMSSFNETVDSYNETLVSRNETDYRLEMVYLLNLAGFEGLGYRIRKL